MLCFPNAKINLGLYVLGRRPNGMHNLETVFLPIPLQDVLEVRLTREGDRAWQLLLAGRTMEGRAEDNLVVRVLESLRREFDLPPVEIHLHKGIPTGAGLGGGSSDAAFMMRLLNEMFDLGLAKAEMKRRLAQIGADCPFFVDDEPAFATGIGDQLEPLSLDLRGKWLVLVKPPCSVSTREAYADVACRAAAPVDLRCELMRPVSEWRGRVENDFEQSVFPQYPQIAAIKQTLYDMGALYASMSGSGSAVFGLFDFRFEDAASVFADCFCYQAEWAPARPVFS